MPVSFQVYLVPEGDTRLLGLGGEAIHGFVFSALLAGDPHYARRVHQSAHKPFSLSPFTEGAVVQGGYTFLTGGQTTAFNISFLDDEAVNIFARGLQSATHRVGDAPVRVADCVLEASASYESLVADAEGKVALLEFLTPTVLKKAGHDLPLPELQTMLSSLRVRWNVFAPPRLNVPADLVEKGRPRFRHFRLRSGMIRFHRFATVGFYGFTELVLPEEVEPRRWTATLLRYSAWSGIGHRTAMGLGRVRLSWVQGTGRASEHPGDGPVQS